jgi:hypothetical protein
LAALTSTPGVYTLTVQGAGVQDSAGNAGTGSASDSWTFAGAGPVVQDIVDVTPDPRNSAVASVDVVFDVPVNLATLTSADFTLTRNGGANSINGFGNRQRTSWGSTYRLGGLAGLTAAAGVYQLTLTGTWRARYARHGGHWYRFRYLDGRYDFADGDRCDRHRRPDPRNTAVASIDVVAERAD